MSSPGQRKGSCGHIMAFFDKHSRCARCRDKGQGNDPCVKHVPCEFCDLLTPEQVLQLATPTYKIRKEKQKSKDALVDPSTVTVVSQVEQEGADRPHLLVLWIFRCQLHLFAKNCKNWTINGLLEWPDWRL